MGTSTNYPARRRAEILEHLRQQGHASIHELADAFQVSEDTVRRDVDELANQGSVERTHGGVTISAEERANINLPFRRRIDTQADAKDAIAKVAASLVTEGQTLFINGGTTTLAMAKYLAATRGITVVTNNLPLPEELYSRGVREVYVLGGSYRLRSQVTIGPVALADGAGHFRALHADVAFIGVGSVSEKGVLSTTSLPEAGIMRGMMDNAGHVVLLADATKFGRTEFAEVATLGPNMTLITDTKPSQALLDIAAESGTEVVVASKA